LSCAIKKSALTLCLSIRRLFCEMHLQAAPLVDAHGKKH